MRRKTHEQFLDEVSHRPFDVIGRYQGDNVKISFRCHKCEQTWRSTPRNILVGSGCRHCWKKSITKTNTDFTKQIKDRPLNALETYKGVWEKIKFRCRVCGHKWDVTPANILSGHGCPECAVGGVKKSNRVVKDLGGWLEIDISSKKHPAAIMLIDKPDWQMLKDQSIGRVYTDGYGYPTISLNRSHKAVHKVLFPDAKGDIDHINGKPHDNRRCNLRVCTHSQNRQNSKKYANNTSGVTGVYWNRRAKKWQADIKVYYKKIYLGLFDSIEEAAAVRKAAEIQYFGEFRRKK